jgi:hypothetical protein
VLFVTQEDMRHLAGSGLRSDEEAASCFSSWYWHVSPSRRMGTAARPSVIVDVDGVAVPERR